jgi:predicted transcriptional regulator
MKDVERDALRKCVLELISKGYVNYTRIEKKAIASCAPYITSNTFRAQFYNYLLANGFIEKIGRGKYALTEKGKNYLVCLSQ